MKTLMSEPVAAPVLGARVSASVEWAAGRVPRTPAHLGVQARLL